MDLAAAPAVADEAGDLLGQRPDGVVLVERPGEDFETVVNLFGDLSHEFFSSAGVV